MKEKFIKSLWFYPKENSNNIFIKKYENNYFLEIDFEKEKINYWDKIKLESRTTQNFSQPENWVVLECVNRLLEKWYNPKDIILEKVSPTGHGTSWRLDILVKKNRKSFLMIECKTWGKEFEKEFSKMQKDGGQLFTYFQQDRDTDYLMLYTSNEKWDYKNEIVKIEDSYKETSNVADFYIRWNKFTKQNGIFDDWVNVYDFESRALTYDKLKDIEEKDSSFIFNRFLEILRHNTVSDKPNAFNKMFTLFLCKIHDEIRKEWGQDELEFQWKEWVDNHISFQKRLSDLYKKWMLDFLNKQITDFSDKEIEDEFWYLDETSRAKILEKFTKIRLQKSNEFAIKEVNDDSSFEENAIVLKEVVELLQNYKFRYSKKQPFLWNFFELLLTTWLKQEAWQFFTPVPIARFICRSIPMEDIIDKKISNWNIRDILPKTIDYAAWSWHFVIESMEEIQKIINKKDVWKVWLKVKDLLKKYKENPYDWAGEYVYGIEKDYRLVRTSKVGCYLHGDWIATVIHGDWLDSFKNSKVYTWDLCDSCKDNEQYNWKFDLVLSNPPYSVSAFKWNLKREDAEKDFDLYNSLTDNSSEIEALFIERTSQLLKEGWITWIILPSSILSNTWIYTKAREIILKDFEIIAITKLGSNTFMATGTNTVTLFLRRRNKYFAKNLKANTDNFFTNLQDVTLNWVENAVSKYVWEIWEWLNFEDYVSLIQKKPSEILKNHDIFKEYKNKITFTKKSQEDKNKEFFEKVIELEKEKLFYFILAFPQKLVLVKSWEKKVEKEFLGYEFSNRKWSEWIHPIQIGRQIDECTKLFDPEKLDNPEKVSTYIYDSFEDNHEREISEELKNHVFRTNLSDLLTFDRIDFKKPISLNSKKKVRIEGKYNLEKIWDLIIENWKSKIKVWEAKDLENWKYNFFTSWENIYKFNEYLVEWKNIYLSTWWNAIIKYFNWKASYSTDTYSIKGKDNILSKYLYLNIESIISDIDNFYFKWQGLRHLQKNDFKEIKIPLPPKEIQQKIVDKIEVLEKLEEKNLEKIWELGRGGWRNYLKCKLRRTS